MLRSVLSRIAPRATAVNRSLAPTTARRAPYTVGIGIGPSSQWKQPLDRRAPSSPNTGRVVSARRCSWRNMSSTSAKVATPVPEGDSGAGKAEREHTKTGGGQDARDPATGEGIWMDDEDEPLDMEKPKKVQKFCGKVVSDNMNKTIKVAVPYWYYVKGLGRKIIRYSKIMAHDEENAANVGDTVILVDCRQKSKRKKHTLLAIVRKLPRLDNA